MTYRHACLLSLAIVLSACGGGGSGSGSSEASPETPVNPIEAPDRGLADSAVQVLAISNEQCPSGGVEIRLGIDADSDGILDPEEVDPARTVTVCHGESNNTLFAISDASAEDCPMGGNELSLGWDENGDGNLSASELTDQYTLCEGADIGHLLVDSYGIPAGEECAIGGEVVSIGLDLNANGSLEDTEVTSSSTYCFDGWSAELDSVSQTDAAVGESWVATINYFIYGGAWEPEVELIEGPDWVSVLGVQGEAILVGGTPDIAGDFSVLVKVSGGSVEDEIELTGTADNAVAISVVEVEGNNLAFELEEPLSQDLEIIYSINYASQGYSGNDARSSLIPVGDSRIEVPLGTGNHDPEPLFSLTSIVVHELRYSGEQNLYVLNNNFIVADSAEKLIIPAGQSYGRPLPCFFNHSTSDYYYSNYYSWDMCAPFNAELIDAPEWMSIHNGSYLSIEELPESLVGQNGSVALTFMLTDGKQYSVDVPYEVVAPDADRDGEPDVSDDFPEDDRYTIDADNDGIADSWELWHVNDLATLTATSDFNSDGITDLSAFEQDLPLNPLVFDFESGALPVGWTAESWSVTDDIAYRGDYSITGVGSYNNLSFPVEIQDSRIALRLFVPAGVVTEGTLNLYIGFMPVNGLGREVNSSFHASAEDTGSWHILDVDVPAGRYNVSINTYQYGNDNVQVSIDWITGFAGGTPGDADQDGIPNYLEQYESDTVGVEGDSDGDGVPNEDDAFPDNASYSEDYDEDGMPDEWENQYGWYDSFYAEDDMDEDGRSNLEEYLAGSSPVIANLSVRPDIIRASSGQTITLAPHLNDGSENNVTLISIDAPATGSLILADGEYRFTPPADYVGWIVTDYTVTDGIDTEQGEIFIKVTDTVPPNLVKLVSGSDGASAALFDDGSLYMWGNNESGQLGNGTLSSSASPSLTMMGVTDVALFLSSASSYNYVVAVKDDGSLWQWGDGDTTPGEVPLPEGELAHQVANSGYEIFIVTRTGSLLRRAASNAFSTLPTLQSVPLVESISAGYDHELILTRDGEVYSRGGNDYGQLGKGNNDYSSVWSPVSKLNVSIAKIATGRYTSFAISDAGDVYAWGSNSRRQLGDGTEVDRNVPVLVASDVAQVAAGINFSLFMTNSGGVLGSGYGNSRVLGRDCSDYPGVTQCIIATDATYVAAGGNTSFIERDGVTQVFGDNSYGLAGTGSYRDRVSGSTVAWLQDAYIGGLGYIGFEDQSIPANWRNTGELWEITNGDTYSGNYSIKTSSTLEDYQTASLAIQTETGTGSVHFKVRTSTEADYDELVFLIDGEEKLRLSGENSWIDSGAFAVTAGLHTFEWRYSKDGGTSAGEDAVWLDDIEIPLDTDGDGLLDSEDPDPNRI